MSYEYLESKLIEFDQIIAEMGLSIEEGSLLKAQFDLIRGFLTDRTELPEDELETKYFAQFKEFYHSLIVVERLTNSVMTLDRKPRDGLRKCLKHVLAGQLTQDFESQQAKDHFYEIEMAALFQECGFEIKLCEPDIVISGVGLTKPYGIACKYPSSEKQIHNHFSKGYRQIAEQGMDGLVAIGIDQIVFKGMNNYIEFENEKFHPLKIMQRTADETLIKLVQQRAKDYPAEKPIDGAIITLAATGIYGEPASLITIRAITSQCDGQNPMLADVERMTKVLNNNAMSAYMEEEV